MRTLSGTVLLFRTLWMAAIRRLSDLLGHEDIETTKKFYARFEINELKRLHDLHTPVNLLS